MLVIELWRDDALLAVLPARAVPVGGHIHMLSAAANRSLAFTEVRVLRDGVPIFIRNLAWRLVKGDGIGIDVGTV